MPLGFLVAAALMAEPPDPQAFLRFERSASLIYVTETVTVAVDGWNATTKRQEYKVHYMWHRQIPDLQRETWVNSRSCPAIRETLEGLSGLEMPKPTAPGIGDVPPMLLDGISYELTAPSSYTNGQLSISSNMNSPLAAWVDRAFGSLQPCLPKLFWRGLFEKSATAG